LTSKQESTGEYVDDSVITTKLKSLLTADDFFKLFQISAETYKGSVQLSGFVGSQKAVDKAVKIERSVKEVKSVRKCEIGSPVWSLAANVDSKLGFPRTLFERSVLFSGFRWGARLSLKLGAPKEQKLWRQRLARVATMHNPGYPGKLRF
jgi:hyperosmotically inducible protein